MSAHLAALHAAAFSEAWSASEIEDLIDAGALAIAEEDGFILIRIAADEAEILTLAVTPDARRSGLGRRLVEDALAAAAQGGAIRMFLEVAADNAPAIALYRRAGFSQAGLRPRYYRRAQGPAQDALIFERALNSR